MTMPAEPTQIADQLDLGVGHAMFGITRGVLEDWLAALANDG
jgi:hypothetical protein